jgi:hypothetical protein
MLAELVGLPEGVCESAALTDIQRREGEHTSVLRAPAWDAHLAEVEDRAFRLLDANRQRYGGFLLLI